MQVILESFGTSYDTHMAQGAYRHNRTLIEPDSLEEYRFFLPLLSLILPTSYPLTSDPPLLQQELAHNQVSHE